MRWLWWMMPCFAVMVGAYRGQMREIARDNRPRSNQARRYLVDIDGTICTLTASKYTRSVPYRNRIAALNRLYDQGVEVHYWTARGVNSGKNWDDFTKEQLDDWGVKYTTLNMGKPHYDAWIDDKCLSIDNVARTSIDAVDECLLNGFDGCEALGYL